MASYRPDFTKEVFMSTKSPVKAGKTTDDFRALYDKNYIVPTRIKEAIEQRGADIWETEKEFLARSKISTTDLALFREDFKEFIVETGGSRSQRIWCGSKAFATKLRAMAT
jgi:hypothetical protein